MINIIDTYFAFVEVIEVLLHETTFFELQTASAWTRIIALNFDARQLRLF